MTLAEKVAYIKGLAEGLELGDSKQEKLLKAIIDVLGDISNEIDDLSDDVCDLAEQIDEVDEDLAALEDEVYCDEDEDDDYDEDEDDEFYEVTCPKCNDTICLDEDMLLEGGIDCPNCGETLEFECSCDCDGCDGCDDED